MKSIPIIKSQLHHYILACTLLFPLKSLAETIVFDKGNITHISFKKIPPNQFEINNNLINIAVNNSSSFLLIPFKDFKYVKDVTFEWKKNGILKVKNAKHEETRNGDDAYLRIGIILKGKAGFENPLAPKWVKQVRKKLQYPSDKMIYLEPESKHKDGEQWASPYNKKVKIIAVGSKAITDGWNYSEYVFENTKPVIGLWIMADGDNTRSTFISTLRSLTLN